MYVFFCFVFFFFFLGGGGGFYFKLKRPFCSTERNNFSKFDKGLY